MAGESFDVLGNGGIFKPDSIEIGSLFLFLASVSILAMLFGRKTARLSLSSLNFARLLVLSLYFFSWLFSLMAAMLAQTNNGNFVSCSIATFACIFLYAGSKIAVYLLMVERARAVTDIGVPRWNSRIFKFNISLLIPVPIIVVLAILYRVTEIHDNGHCVIGIQLQASITLITYDILINTWLTALFIRTLFSSTSQLQGPTKSKLRNVAHRTLVGTVLALISSTTNLSTIAATNGHTRGALCLALCSLDVVFSAITIHWVTSVGEGSNPKPNSNINAASGDRSPRYTPHSGSAKSDKCATPLESHLSVSIDSYVEEYRQLHIVNNTTLEKPL